MQDAFPPTLPTHPDQRPVVDFEGFRTLACVLGPDRMTRMASTFFADAERRLTLLERAEAGPADLQEHTHSLISMAGHLGLRRLSALCVELQEQARQGGGLERRPALRRAIGEAQAAIHAAVAQGVLHDTTMGKATPSVQPTRATAGVGRAAAPGDGFEAAGQPA